MVGSGPEADDLTQEVLLRGIRGLRQCRKGGYASLLRMSLSNDPEVAMLEEI